MITHAYLKYAMALLMEENGLPDESEVTFAHIKSEIIKGLDAFCVKPVENYVGKEYVKFGFVNEQNKAPQFVYLAPNVIATEMNASNLYKSAKKIFDLTSLNLEKKDKVTQSQIPTAGEFCSFSDSGNIGRGKPEASNLYICLGMITSTTPLKPCLQYMSGTSGKISTDNVCLIPDLEIPQLIDFIKLFKRLRLQKLSDMMVGKVDLTKGKNEEYKPKRPRLYCGNFPNAPRSSALGAIALLGSIGEMIKDKDVSELARRVLDSFKDHKFYSFRYGDAQVFGFNHHIINLAKEGHLRRVVDNLYYVFLYNQGQRRFDNMEYQKFDLFASRFLQLFNKPAFRDFLSFRAEYPAEISIMLKTYFIHMENISEEIVQSAKALGHWLNLVAYSVAKAETKDEETKGKEQFRELKAKVLVEMESSIFAAKSADALIAHTIARAGRLSATDAPAEASLFIEKVASGGLALEQAKNLLIAFSRLKSAVNKNANVGNENLCEMPDDDSDEDKPCANYSNI